MALVLEQQYIDEMIAHAKEDAPNECCGIIAGVDGRATKLYRAINAEATPYRYSVEPRICCASTARSMATTGSSW